MKFLFLDSWLRDRAAGSGSAVAIAGLARGLEALGHHVEVLRPRQRLPSLDLTRLLYNLRLPRRFARTPPDCDVVVGFDFDGWRLRGRPAGRTGPRYVVALKGVAAEERSFESGWHRLRFDLFTRLERRNARSAERVFVTSEYAAGAARRAYDLDPRRVRIAPEALDDAILERASADPPAPTAADSGPSIVLSVARQYRRKDTPTLLRAFALALQRVPGARLRVVGDGPELGGARRLAGRLGIERSVTFLGALSSIDELDAEYRAARLFCLPSRQEGFGIVFLEAMAYGLPIAAARAGAVPEVAPDRVTSLLSAPGDEEALADSLVRLLTDDGLAWQLGAAGRARAPRFDWPSAARAFLAGLEPAR